MRCPSSQQNWCAAQQVTASEQHLVPVTDDYTFEAVIGQGAVGIVHAARRRTDGEPVVIKEVALDASDTSSSLSALQEAHTLSEFNHLNIVQYLEARWNDGAPV